MKQCLAFFLLMMFCSSCFLFSDLKKKQFSFSEDGTKHSVNTVVPKKYSKTQTSIDSSGNQVQYFFYPGGAQLYFALLKDTTTQLQTILYNDNLPKALYHTIYYKGLDSSDHYWRETRFGSYRAGYRKVNKEDEGKFDSSINYFSLHLEP